MLPFTVAPAPPITLLATRTMRYHPSALADSRLGCSEQPVETSKAEAWDSNGSEFHKLAPGRLR